MSGQDWELFSKFRNKAEKESRRHDNDYEE